MSPRFWFRLLTIVVGALGACSIRAADVPARPNFILIVMDDLGWADLGCYGSTFHRTPHLDRMARKGMRFTDAYAAAPVCSPTRAALLTGRAPARLQLTDWLPGRDDRPDQKMRRPAIQRELPAEVPTLARALQKAGYRTAHIGKWHLGGSKSRPQDHGFDRNIAGDHRGTPASYFAPYGRGTNVIPGLEKAPPGEYLTDRLTLEAEKFIEANRDRPFFLQLDHFAVHIPLAARAEIVQKYAGLPASGTTQTNALYAAMIESMDESVGRILRRLSDLGLAEQTVVVFTSDNGGLSVREGPHTPATSNAPWRAGKGYLYEGGLRVPLLVRWPGRIAAAQVATEPVVSMDLPVTLLELAGVTNGLPGPVDGVSIARRLLGGEAPSRGPIHWHYPHYANQGGKPGGAIREGPWKLVEHYESGYLELFQLREDPSERTNRAGAFPERANEMAKKLASWRKAVGAQNVTTNADYVPVPILQADDGSVRLPAHEVIVHGINVRYEPPAHKNTVGYWTRPEDWVEWHFAIKRPGTFVVEVLQGCGKGSGGSDVDVLVGDQRLSFQVQDTGHFQNFVPRDIGSVTLSRAGPYTLAIKPQRKPGVAVMDVRQVLLKPKAP